MEESIEYETKSRALWRPCAICETPGGKVVGGDKIGGEKTENRQSP